MFKPAPAYTSLSRFYVRSHHLTGQRSKVRGQLIGVSWPDAPELVADGVQDTVDLVFVLLVRDHLLHFTDGLAEGAVGPGVVIIVVVLQEGLHMLGDGSEFVAEALVEVELGADLEYRTDFQFSIS